MKSKRQYLIVDTKRYRRHSAPENLSEWYTPRQSRQSLPEREDWWRASVSDFSVLLENQSESGSSLELDTSRLSRDLSPVPTAKTLPQDSYQNFPVAHFESGKTGRGHHRHGFGSWLLWKNIILSQAIAGCVAIMDVSNINLRNNSKNLATNGQNLPSYIFLGVFWTTKLALRNGGRDILHVIKYSGLRYLFLAVLHVETNNLLLSTFHHHTYLGNQVVDWIAASLCLLIDFVCLEVQFHLVHTSGFGFVTAGAIGLFIADAMRRNQKYEYEDVLVGDVLRIASGICLAFNSTAQEIIVKSIDFVEYLGMIGLLGSLICCIQALILEKSKIAMLSSTHWLNVVAYSIVQALFSSVTPKAVHEMGAPGLHLALVASQCYSSLIQAILQLGEVHILCLIPYGVTLTGSILFLTKRTVIGTEKFFPVKVTIIKES